MSNQLQTSDKWLETSPFNIIDADGWDRLNFNYSFYKEMITEQEFNKRLANSTTIGKVPSEI